MKKFGAILSLALIIVMMACSLSFAGSFQVEKTYPKDGDHDKSVDNFCLKVYFNESVHDSDKKANAKCVTVVDEEGEKLPVSLYYSPKEKGMMMALVEPENTAKVKQDTEYTITISGDFQNDNGDTLGEDYVVSFKTLNSKRATMINMIMMAVMFGGIMIFSTKSMKKEAAKEAEKRGAEEKVNPYKVAKETGKSVEEIVAQDQKKKAKKAASQARRVAKDKAERDKLAQSIAEAEEKPAGGAKHVKGPRPISAGGSTYITGRKALAEEARRKGTTNPKNKSGKGGKKK